MQTRTLFESLMQGVHQWTKKKEKSFSDFYVYQFPVCFSSDGSVPLERFHRILNETERRLSMLRGSVESPALGSKIQKLHSAAKEQQSRLSLIEQDIQEIREERESLGDIASNLPQSCPQALGEGKA